MGIPRGDKPFGDSAPARNATRADHTPFHSFVHERFLPWDLRGWLSVGKAQVAYALITLRTAAAICIQAIALWRGEIVKAEFFGRLEFGEGLALWQRRAGDYGSLRGVDGWEGEQEQDQERESKTEGHAEPVSDEDQGLIGCGNDGVSDWGELPDKDDHDETKTSELV